jgi:hypothetical protein
MADSSSVAGPNVAIIFVRLGIVVIPLWLKTIKKPVKNPSPEDPALTSPQRYGVYFETPNGMME